MGKYSDFPSQTSKVRSKSVIYTPKRDDKHPDHFDMGVPTPPPPGGGEGLQKRNRIQHLAQQSCKLNGPGHIILRFPVMTYAETPHLQIGEFSHRTILRFRFS